jgi:hypothetical protein
MFKWRVPLGRSRAHLTSFAAFRLISKNPTFGRELDTLLAPDGFRAPIPTASPSFSVIPSTANQQQHRKGAPYLRLRISAQFASP